MELLRIENVEKYYGKEGNITKAVDGISLSVESGEFDEFLSLYDIKEGDGMHLSPQDRVTIW